jgi:hypothetical protein
MEEFMGNFRERGLGMALLFLLSVAPQAFADPNWDQSLGLTKDQLKELKGFNKTKSDILHQAQQDREGSTEALMKQVLAGDGESAVQATLGQVLFDVKAMEKAEEDYWNNLQAFLSPAQAAQIYLKIHPPLPGPEATPKGSKASVHPKDNFRWGAYIGLDANLLGQLRSANLQWSGQMKEKKEEKASAAGRLEKLIQAKGPDSDIQANLKALLAAVQAQHEIDQDYWEKALPGFLSPTQVAKLYLHRLPPKEGFHPPPQALKKK